MIGRRMSRRTALLGAGVLVAVAEAAGCAARPRFPLPYSPGQLARDSVTHPGPALAHYLSQADADAAVCDLDAKSDHVGAMDERAFAVLLEALTRGAITPATWSTCVLALMAHAPAALATQMLDSVAATARDALEEAKAPADAPPALAALATVLVEHPLAARASADSRTALRETLDAIIASNDTPPRARQHARDISEAVELDAGIWQGATVTRDTIVALADEALLQRLAARLPDADLRHEAKRRVINLRIAASSFAEVRERAAVVEERMLTRGRNAVALGETAVRRAWYEPRGELPRVLIRQDIERQRASLFSVAAAVGDGEVAIVPTLDLRDALFFELVGVSRPVTLCGPRAALSPDPCVEASELALGTRAARFDDDGRVHFADDLALAEAAQLIERSESLALRPSWQGAEIMAIELPITFATPAALVLWGEPGRPGPKLEVRVSQAGRYLVVWTQNLSEGSRPRRVAIVPRSDARAFYVASQGGPGLAGTAGSPGTAGTRGTNGMNAMCPSSPGQNGGNGSAGGRGGDGGPGGPAGDGGLVKALVDCTDKSQCDDLLAVAKEMARSAGGRGGDGGAGGQGGRGGDGGSGGSGTSCYDSLSKTTKYLSGGSAGSKGADGSPGSAGAPGRDGEAGPVEVTLASPPAK